MAGSNDVGKDCGLKQSQVQALFAVMLRAIRDGKSVQIRGFGTFSPATRNARMITTPILPEGIMSVPLRNSIKFKISQSAWAFMNNSSKDYNDKDAKEVDNDKPEKKPRTKIAPSRLGKSGSKPVAKSRTKSKSPAKK